MSSEGYDERASDEFATWLDALRGAADEDELFELLATQRPPSSKLARQQLRGRLVSLLNRKLKELESGAAAARTADAWLQDRVGPDDSSGLQGQGFVIEEVTPWEASVVGAAALDEARAVLASYVHAPAEALDAITLWGGFTHVFDCFGVAPILDLSSPTRRCGKSSTVVVLRHLCWRPLLSGNITPAALFRSVEAWKPTLLIDEADTFAKMSDELRGILNAGHTRDTAFVVRAEGDANEPRLFSTWAPKLVAAIGRLPDTIEDRSIRVVLMRKPVGVRKRDAFDPQLVRRDCEEVRRRLARFALDALEAIKAADPERPEGLNDRAWNNWRPLFAIAEAAGGEWPQRARAAALALSLEEDEEEDVGMLALRHTWEVLEPAGRLATADILRHLVEKDEGPWAEWWEAQVAKDELKSPAARLAKLLKPFGVKPGQVWIGERNVRGYNAEHFEDALVYLLQKDARDVEDARTRSSTGAASSVPSVSSEFLGGASENGHRPPTRVGQPRRQAELDHLDEVFAPLRSECLTCGSEYLADDAHPLRCPECTEGTEAA